MKLSDTVEVSPQGPEDTVDDGAHADVPGKHVEDGQDGAPSKLSREVGSHNAEQHGYNVQHNALHHEPFAMESAYTSMQTRWDCVDGPAHVPRTPSTLLLF